MRTTLDIPDDLFKHAKLAAVHEGVPLKIVIARALERGLGVAAAASLPPVNAPRETRKPVSETWKSVREILEEGWAAKPPQPVEYRNPHKQKILEAIRSHEQRRR